MISFLGCESKKRYDINSDKMIGDLNTRISSLEEDLKNLTGELEEVRGVLPDPDIDTELRKSLRKEIHEGDKYIKEINQWIAYLKVQRKQRYASLSERKDQENLEEQAKKEIKAYFVTKDLKPIKRPWLNRYRTAIEL